MVTESEFKEIRQELRDNRKEMNRLSQRQNEMTKILQASTTGVITVRMAALFGYLSEDSLYKAIANKELKAYRPTPHKLFIDWEDFCRFLRRNPTTE